MKTTTGRGIALRLFVAKFTHRKPSRGRALSASQNANPKTARYRESERGQLLVIFSGIFVILLLMAALVIDLAWLWSNTLQIQRAADAAALAGVVQLPDHQATAYSLAIDEAIKNGYTDGVGNVSVDPVQDLPNNKRRLTVTVTAPVKTFFLGLIGMNTITISRSSNAEFVLPVPMGSPENYYGVFGQVRDATFTTTGTVNHPNSSSADLNNGSTWDNAGSQPAGNWSNPSRADGNNNNNNAASNNANGSAQQWGDFGLNFNPTFVSVQGVQVRLRALVTGSDNPTTDCRLNVDLSSNGGTSWTATRNTAPLTTGELTYSLGGIADLWGRAWVAGDFANGSSKFRVRLTWAKANCGANRTASVDTLEVNVIYTYSTSGTSMTTADYALTGPGAPCANGKPNCFTSTPAGGGQALSARGFWASMNTEGSENVNGDAFQPYYDSRTNKVAPNCPSLTGRACYGPDDYYNYAIAMPPNSSGGYVYIFDPVFCDTGIDSGTGERWFSGTGTGISSFYELYSDPNNTPYTFSDDAAWLPIDNTFRQIGAADTSMGGSGGSECRQKNTLYGDGRDYHNSWYLLNPTKPLTGGPSGTIYRLHTASTEKAAATQQRGADGEQSFAIYATDAQAPAVYPKVYGLGAMQMFTPLSASGSAVSSEFYLAQIDAVHKTKTLELQLWDPGDTDQLSAYIEVLIPNSTGWIPATFSYTATVGTTDSSANSSCNTNANPSTTKVTTSNGNGGLFNGCWLTIDTVIPSWYNADQSGWWKIRYTMNKSGTSSDVTTWTANIRGNPVHLIEP